MQAWAHHGLNFVLMTGLLVNSALWSHFDNYLKNKVNGGSMYQNNDVDEVQWDKLNFNQIGFLLRDLLLLTFFFHLFKLKKIQLILNP